MGVHEEGGTAKQALFYKLYAVMRFLIVIFIY